MIRIATKGDYGCVKSLKDASALHIEDIKDTSYRLSIEINGFLLNGEYSIEDHIRDLQKIFLVYEYEGKVVGFVRIDDKPEMKETNNIYWFRPAMKSIYFSIPHADIGGIMVATTVRNMGFASMMLQEAIFKIKDKNIKYLFSFVALSPVTNIPSLLFHEKNGFERIAIVTHASLFHMNHYQSFLFGLKLN
ncbi:MAG: GNAT family N-acetyltransferase [Candidatus Gottesmanbacteria bacterium]